MKYNPFFKKKTIIKRVAAECQAPCKLSGRSSPMVEDEKGKDISPTRVGPADSEQKEVPRHNSEEMEELSSNFTFLSDLSLLFFK